MELGTQKVDAAHHAPMMIYPNPLNPSRYVVLNSGFTFREYDYLNNARQVPKLPDFAVIDVSTPPNSRFPGKVVRAGFFDENWALQEKDGEYPGPAFRTPSWPPSPLGRPNLFPDNPFR